MPGAILRNANTTSLILPSELHTISYSLFIDQTNKAQRKVKYKVTKLGFQQKPAAGDFLKKQITPTKNINSQTTHYKEPSFLLPNCSGEEWKASLTHLFTG